MDGLLKGSCDACTASKVKCSGGNPCTRCSGKKLTCSYRPKRKRGPQKGAKAGAAKKAVRTEDFAFVSSYEKRVWSVFFTMFKNQNRSRSDAPYAWCWFASQLEKLKAHLEEQHNENALNRLTAWLDALDVDLASITGGLKKKCTFSPHQCGSCSAIAMSAPNERGQPLRSDVNVGERQPFDVTCNDRPRLLISTTSCGTTVEVNNRFVSELGCTAHDLQALIDWLGGGFLPWGGDVLAKMFVKESDVLVFLQILAIKFQAIGPPKHGQNVSTQREVPSTHIFELWCLGDDGSRAHKTCLYLMHCLHLERIDNDVMVTEARISLERVGTPANPTGVDKAPVVADEATGKTLIKSSGQMAASVPPPVKQEQAAAPPAVPAPAIPAVDTVPAEFEGFYDNWHFFEHDGAGSSGLHGPPALEPLEPLEPPPPPPPHQHHQEGGGGEYPVYHGDGRGGADEDATWLNSLLEWSATNNSAPYIS